MKYFLCIDACIVLIIINCLVGMAYNHIKQYFYSSWFLQKDIKSFWYWDIPFWKRIIIQNVYPLQFIDTIIHGHPINVYVNEKSASFPALPITPTWLPDASDRSHYAYSKGQSAMRIFWNPYFKRVYFLTVVFGSVAIVVHLLLMIALFFVRCCELLHIAGSVFKNMIFKSE